MFRVTYSNQAVKFLKNCDRNLAERVLEKIEKLAENPILPETIKLKGDEILRVRVGKIRVLYIVKSNDKTILVAKIDKRCHVYD
jgi:mRNA interferase RelE/StbE